MKQSRTQVRIIAGTLRGRKIDCIVHEGLRPTPQMVREAMFSILGNAVPDRPFYDLFAGTGVNGLESLSRGASKAIFVERDAKLGVDIDGYLKKFGLTAQGMVIRTDVYRWADRWVPGPEPVNLFLSPPFADLTTRLEAFLKMVTGLMEKAPVESVLVIQAEDGFPEEMLPTPTEWDIRKYGRNMLYIWVKDPIAEGQEVLPKEGAETTDAPEA